MGCGSAGNMIHEVIRAIIQRVMRDKILMGLIVIGVLAIFMTGASEDGSKSKNTEESLPPGAQMPQQGQPPPQQAKEEGHDEAQAQQPPPAQAKPQFAIEPTLASDFVKWWMGGAMDYQASTSQKNHQEAFKWMSPEAQQTFQEAFWNDTMAQGITSGMLVAAFQPVSVQAQAVNPDGSVVVSMKGSLVLQMNGQPADTRQVVTDFLVKKEDSGLRIAAICNRSYAQAQSPTAYYY